MRGNTIGDNFDPIFLTMSRKHIYTILTDGIGYTVAALLIAVSVVITAAAQEVAKPVAGWLSAPVRTGCIRTVQVLKHMKVMGNE